MLNTILIKTELIKQGKSQTELAEFAKKSKAVMSHYINNKRSTPLIIAYKISVFIGLPIEDLLLLDAA